MSNQILCARPRTLFTPVQANLEDQTDPHTHVTPTTRPTDLAMHGNYTYTPTYCSPRKIMEVLARIHTDTRTQETICLHTRVCMHRNTVARMHKSRIRPGMHTHSTDVAHQLVVEDTLDTENGAGFGFA